MIVLYVLAGWLVLSLLAYLLVLPLLTVSARSDRRDRAGWSAAVTAGGRVPSPQQLGYAGMVLERLAEHARTVLGFDQAWILVSAPRRSAPLVAVAGAGTDPDLIGRSIGGGGGVAPAGVASAPISRGSEVSGRLFVGGPDEQRTLNERERHLLAELAGLVGEQLDHHGRGQLMLGDSEPEIRALVKALAEADGATYAHALAVAASARAVAETMRLDAAQLVEVELAALLHDVGKLRIPASVLDRPGRLNEQERQLTRLHPEWGAEMVAQVPGLEAVAMIVRLHHEQPDGQGYPYGLSGDRIPMASRIVSACAAYGVMTRRWAYSDPVDMHAALEELRQRAGTQFDPDVVEALASYVMQPVALAA